MNHSAVSNDCDFTTIAQYLAFADLEQLRFAIDRNTDAVTARVTHRRWTSVLQHREHHVAHLAFVFRRHHDDVWHGAQVRDVEQTMMRLAVAARDTATVETELHVQILDADVVYQLIETTLQEGRVDRADWLQSFARHASGKRDAVLLGEADVERHMRKILQS